MSRAPQVTSHSWERRERAPERKGGGLTVTPAASETHLPPGNSSEMKKHPKRNTHKATFKRLLSPFLNTRFTHDLGEIKLLALRYHLEPQSQGRMRKSKGEAEKS